MAGAGRQTKLIVQFAYSESTRALGSQSNIPLKAASEATFPVCTIGIITVRKVRFLRGIRSFHGNAKIQKLMLRRRVNKLWESSP